MQFVFVQKMKKEGSEAPSKIYEFRVRDSSEFVTLGKFSKILRLFLNILVKVSRKQFFKKSVLADKRHWNQGGPPKF